jgi:hypothetical protein
MSSQITETMTVNAILRTWPEARMVFRAFAIDCDADGSCFLDELCWWRGLDLHALVAALRQLERYQADERTMPQPAYTGGGGVYAKGSGRKPQHVARLEEPAENAGR